MLLINVEEYDFGKKVAIKECFENTKKYIESYGPNTIVLTQIGDFYEVYALENEDYENDPEDKNQYLGSNIELFSEYSDLYIGSKNLNVTRLKDNKILNIKFAGFKILYIEKYANRLKNNNLTIVRIDQIRPGADAPRELKCVYSPGTYFCDTVEIKNGNKIITNNTSCIWIESNKELVSIGISNIDIYTGDTEIFEYTIENIRSITIYDDLERFISMFNPNEVIIISKLNKDDLNVIIELLKIQYKAVHDINMKGNKKIKNCEKQTYQKKLLEKFYEFESFDIFFENFYKSPIATQSFCYLLDFIYERNSNLVKKIKEPKFSNNLGIMLANHSLNQLHILNDGTSLGKFSSLSSMLNDCITNMGKRRFHISILKPTSDINYLNTEYDITEYLINKPSEHHKSVLIYLKGISDIQKNVRQFLLEKINPSTIYNLYSSLINIKKLYNFLKDDEILMEYIKSKCDVNLDDINSIKTYINEYLNIERCKNIKSYSNFNECIIKNGVSDELDDLIENQLGSSEKLDSLVFFLNKIIKDNDPKKKDINYINIVNKLKNGISLETTLVRSRLLQNAIENLESLKVTLNFQSSFTGLEEEFTINLKNIDYEESTKTKVLIKNKAINKLSENSKDLKEEANTLINELYNKIIKKIEKKYIGILTSIAEFVTIIDIIYCKALIAIKYNYCKPKIINSDNSFIEAKNLRHPIIECITNNEIYIPNDLELNATGMILFGVNGIGKTSYIRSSGILIFMAQCGLFVPCSSLIYYPYKKIFTRILGNDNMFKGQSSFIVEMLELRTILRLFDNRSLIIGDEIAKGTTSNDANCIFAQSLLDLTKSKCTFIFATHLHDILKYDEIKDLIKEEKLFVNSLSVIYNREKDKLIYGRKLIPGSGLNTYGIEVCKSLDLPSQFIDGINSFRSKYYPEVSSILDKKTSKYSSSKIREMCEKCNENISTETHHLYKQCLADNNGFITCEDGRTFHKNHPANLITVCEKCHLEFHEST